MNDIVNEISNLSNINIVNVPFLCAGGKAWEGGCQCLPLSLSKQKYLDYINKAHGKLTDVNLVLYQ